MVSQENPTISLRGQNPDKVHGITAKNMQNPPRNIAAKRTQVYRFYFINIFECLFEYYSSFWDFISFFI